MKVSILDVTSNGLDAVLKIGDFTVRGLHLTPEDLRHYNAGNSVPVALRLTEWARTLDIDPLLLSVAFLDGYHEFTKGTPEHV